MNKVRLNRKSKWIKIQMNCESKLIRIKNKIIRSSESQIKKRFSFTSRIKIFFLFSIQLGESKFANQNESILSEPCLWGFVIKTTVKYIIFYAKHFISLGINLEMTHWWINVGGCLSRMSELVNDFVIFIDYSSKTFVNFVILH